MICKTLPYHKNAINLFVFSLATALLPLNSIFVAVAAAIVVVLSLEWIYSDMKSEKLHSSHLEEMQTNSFINIKSS